MQIYHYLQEIRRRQPLIHSMTNSVTIHDMADALIAVGASPMMAVEIKELGDIQSFSQALILNIGTLTEERLKAMLEAGRAANKQGVPIILDPVGAGATRFRSEAVHHLLSELDMTIIKGNAGEIAHLAGADWQSKGVDAGRGHGDLDEMTRSLAQKYDCLAGLSGEVDILSDGQDIIHVKNGHPLMSQITGSGDMLAHICGAFCAVAEADDMEAFVQACVYFAVAGEEAALDQRVRGNASFRTALVDHLYGLTDEKVQEKSKWEVI